MDVVLSSNFIKKPKRLPHQEKERLSQRTEWFRKDTRDPRLKTHTLTGRLKGQYAMSLTYSKRVIFVFLDKNKVMFTHVGTHDDVHK